MLHTTDPIQPETSNLPVLRVEEIHDLVAYLRAARSFTRAHRSEVADELSNLIASHDVSRRAAELIVETGDPVLIEKVLAKTSPSLGVPFSTYVPLLVKVLRLDFTQIPQKDRIAVFELAKAGINKPAEYAGSLTRDAIREGDMDFLDHLLCHYKDVPRAEIFLNPHYFPPRHPAMVERLAETLEETDAESEQVENLAHLAIRQLNAHAVAALIKSGVRIGRYIKPEKVSHNSWLDRLTKKIGSAHGEIEIHENLPSIREILTMDTDALHLAMGGLSEGRRKKLERHRKREEARRKYETWLAAQQAGGNEKGA